MVDMAYQPPVERFPTVSDLECPADPTGSFSVPTFSSLDVEPMGSGDCSEKVTCVEVDGHAHEELAAATVAGTATSEAASSSDKCIAAPTNTQAAATATDAQEADDPLGATMDVKTDPLAATLDVNDVTAFPTADLSVTSKLSEQDLEVTFDASQLQTLPPVTSVEGVPPAAAETAESLPPAPSSLEDDLDTTVHMPRVGVRLPEPQEPQEPLTPTKLMLKLPSIKKRDESEEIRDERRGYEALMRGRNTAASSSNEFLQPGGRSSQSAQASTNVPRADPFLQRPYGKGAGRPREASTSAERFQFCSNRSKKDSRQHPPSHREDDDFSLTSILQSFFICFSRQSG
mmetsp:Transcript_67448/g.161814  ORF Transcript_67448/g.161814 Transcript_67448/m.161814 type:complete len:345 (-) Transcript_67448:129-1163(-)|eukprot:CAMPEP_0178413928 /NCGR_PEP_ID=MMETSP0689_2-20121128/22777_1 /TAXON_ID=160604 /ORGANISM="Amphidinium massartii, Strain CS-259" /LENGTH=344 /DNA_ID=CAMNT_0020035209 /DNA_START=124 /DNA_END=1158 /DNA_ORIENTATION=-